MPSSRRLLIRVGAVLVTLGFVLEACGDTPGAQTEITGDELATETARTTEQQTVLDERPTFSEAQILHENAVDGTIQCLRDQGFDADATLNFTGIFYTYGIHSDGTEPGITEYEFTSRQTEALDSCSEEHDLQRAVDQLQSYLEPSNDELGDIALTCAASLDLDVGSGSESPESMLANVFRDEAGQVCAEEAIGELMRGKTAELLAAEQE